MALHHQHHQHYYNIATETGDEVRDSQHYTNPRKRKVHIMGQNADVPHCCTAWETCIRQFEKDAYASVLRAFKSQADSISWERESLITNLRQELRLSNDEHGEILCKIKAENCYQGIRESCRACGDQYGVTSATNLSYNIGLYEKANGPQHKQTKRHSGLPHQPSGLSPAFNQQFSLTKGRKSLTVKNHRNGLHALSVNFASGNDNLRWIDLTKCPTGEIQLENEDPKMTTLPPQRSRPSRENKSLASEIYCKGEGQGIFIQKRKPESDIFKVPGGSEHHKSETQIRITDDLLQTVMSNNSVKKVFNGCNVDSYTIGNVKEVLKDHEKALIRVLESLADISDCE